MSRWAQRASMVGLVIVLGTLLAGCSDPDRVILDRLDPGARERFLAGRRVAGPCLVCHNLADPVNKVGPSLQGLYGRRSGQAPDYQSSDALRAASIVWDDRSLAAFLANPSGYVPGNRMVAQGIRDPGQLSDLVFYLRHVTPVDARSVRRGG